MILSGTADPARWPEAKLGAPPIAWLGPAFLPESGGARASRRTRSSVPATSSCVRNAPDTVGTVLREAFMRPGAPPLVDPLASEPPQDELPGLGDDAGVQPPAAPPPVDTLSYSSLANYEQCAYRFYLERVLRLPPDEPPPGVTVPQLFEAPAGHDELPIEAMLRGTLAHELLEEIDLRAPELPAPRAARGTSPAATRSSSARRAPMTCCAS